MITIDFMIRNKIKQAQLGVPHSETQVGLQSYFNWGRVSVGGDTAHTFLMEGTIGEGTLEWVVGSGQLDWFLQKRIPLRGSILQAGTCQILSLAKCGNILVLALQIGKRY